MPRFEIASRWALAGALVVPALASAQSVEPPASPAPSEDAKPPESRLFRGPNYPVIDETTLPPARSDAPKPPPQVVPDSFDYVRFHPLTPSTVTQAQALTSDPFLSYYSAFNDRKPVEIRPQPDNPLMTLFGIELADADDALRSQLEIPAGQGVVIVGVKPGSLAEHGGLKPNDVLMMLGEEKAASVKEASKVLLNLGRKALEVKLIREGKPSRMSLVGPEHGFPPEAAEYWIGVPVSPVDAVLRAHLPGLAADAGLIANDVVKGSPASKAGLQKNDILVMMSGKPLKSSDALIEQIQAAEGKPVAVVLFRAGKAIHLAVTPEKRTHPTMIRYKTQTATPLTDTNSYQLAREYYMIRPQVGIEVLTPQPQTQSFTYHGTAQKIQADKPIDIQLQVRQPEPRPADEATARIEAQLKAMSAKLDELRKSVDELRKPEGK